MGAFDPNIILHGKPAPILSATDVYAQALDSQTKRAQLQEVKERTADMSLQRQERQLNLNAQNAMGTAIQNNMSIGSDGAVSLNYAGAMNDLSAGGYGPAVLKLDSQRRADLTEVQKLFQEQIATAGKKAERVSSWAASIPQVDYAQTDPNVLQQQTSAAQSSYRSAIQGMLNEGLLDPQSAAQVKDLPYTPELQQHINQQIAAGKSSSQQMKDVGDHLEALHKQAMARPEEDEAEAKATTAGLGAAAQSMPPSQSSGNGQVDTGDTNENQNNWTEWRDTQSERIRKYIPQRWSPQNELTVRKMGMSPTAQQSAEFTETRLGQADTRIQQAADRVKDVEQKWRDQMDLMNQRLGLAERAQDQRDKRSNTPQTKTAQSGFDKANKDYETAQTQRQQLRAALTSGGIYVDDKGNLKQMDVVTGGDDKQSESLTQEMKQRYAIATERLKDSLQRRNQFADTLEIPYSTSTEDAMKAIDEEDKTAPAPKETPQTGWWDTIKGYFGSKPKAAPAPAAPQATPQATTPKAKTQSTPQSMFVDKKGQMKDVHGFATANNWTDDQAVQWLKANKYKLQ